MKESLEGWAYGREGQVTKEQEATGDLAPPHPLPCSNHELRPVLCFSPHHGIHRQHRQNSRQQTRTETLSPNRYFLLTV